MEKAKIVGICIVGARTLTNNRVVGRTRTNKELVNQKEGVFPKAVRIVATIKKENGDKRVVTDIISDLSTKRQAGKFRRNTGEVYNTWAKVNNII